jgi:hypothetical protein
VGRALKVGRQNGSNGSNNEKRGQIGKYIHIENTKGIDGIFRSWGDKLRV